MTTQGPELSWLVLALSAAVFCSCQREPKPSAEVVARPALAETAVVPYKPDPALEARQIFDRRCSVCHGASGRGDGPGSAALNPKPQSFSDLAWQSKVTDEEIGRAILGGGLAVGRTAGMPSNPDLQSKPEVIRELVNLLRGFKPATGATAGAATG
jgi:mono/diheme cytochrome c family protein